MNHEQVTSNEKKGNHVLDSCLPSFITIEYYNLFYKSKA